MTEFIGLAPRENCNWFSYDIPLTGEKREVETGTLWKIENSYRCPSCGLTGELWMNQPKQENLVFDVKEMVSNSCDRNL